MSCTTHYKSHLPFFKRAGWTHLTRCQLRTECGVSCLYSPVSRMSFVVWSKTRPVSLM